MSLKSIPLRSEVKVEDTWDLTHLYSDDKKWMEDFTLIEGEIENSKTFEKRVGESPQTLLEVLQFLSHIGQIFEKLGQYAFLHHAGDASNSENQRRMGLINTLSTKFSAATSYIEPEILAIDPPLLEKWIAAKEFDEYRVMIQKMVRFRPHILSSSEERIMALQREVGSKAQEAFNALTNVDLEFGSINTKEGKIALTQSTYSLLLQNRDRSVRQRAYHKFYTVFDSHKHTLTHLYDTSVKQHQFSSTARSYSDTRSMALFADKVDPSVYDTLISTVHDYLGSLHRYYEIRRELLGLKKLAHYDVYVPLVESVEIEHTYDEAVTIIGKALEPLGEEYVSTLTEGLTVKRWVDKYENRGKRSGAFSSGTFLGPPYILMNYEEKVLRDVFTLAHEGGHSMHSYYSAKNNPFPSYDYTIFEAEVASTFNEQLLAHYMLERAENREVKAYILGKQIDDIVATLYRQTMFAEYERDIHKSVESGEPITVELLRSTYRTLLEHYFGPKVQLFGVSDLEGLRIPHFYRPFYVYKYATGLSASIALAQRVLQGTEGEREQYLTFLKSGGSHYPLEALKKAGVDMSSSAPIESALSYFDSLLDSFERLVSK